MVGALAAFATGFPLFLGIVFLDLRPCLSVYTKKAPSGRGPPGNRGPDRGPRETGDLLEVTRDQVLGWLSAGRLQLGNSVSHQFPLEDYASGLSVLRDRSGNAIRVVITNEP